MSNYTTKADFKKIKDFDTSEFIIKYDLNNLKSDAGKLDFDKLKKM